MRAPAPGGPPEQPRRPPSEPTPIAPRPDSLVASEVVAGRGPGSVVDTAPPRAPSLLSGFRALRHRDFRLFFAGQFVSLIGTWMQSLAQSWLVLTLTNSAFALGLVGALQFLPVLLFSAVGGTIADHLPKRQVLLVTQSAQMILAFILAFLVFEQSVTYESVLVLAFLLGVANAVDMPTRQAFVVELVGPEDLMNAIALNSSLFNAARLIGPALAGLLIGIVGLAVAFFLNGVSFFAVILSLLLMSPPPQPARRLGSFRKVILDLREGFRYVLQTTPVLGVILILGVVGTFGANFNVVTPLMAQEMGVGATGLGWLMAAMGFGSLVASLALAYLGKEAHPVIILGAVVAIGVFEVALAVTTNFGPALVLLAIIGAAMVIQSALSNTLVQLAVPHRLRGRVMSIYTTVFVGTTPIGNTIIGAVAETTGTVGPLLLGGVLSLAAAALFGRMLWKGRR
ncbi:MAG TPA: MFS transporter [Chloroflexota bacterium]|nr:MFS transporter [Chloroflexota bacterium]